MKRTKRFEAQVMFLMGESEDTFFNYASILELDDEWCGETDEAVMGFNQVRHAVLMLADAGCVVFQGDYFRVTLNGYHLYEDEMG